MTDKDYTEFGATSVADAVLAGICIAEPEAIGGSDRFFTQVVPAGADLKVLDLNELEKPYLDRPRRKRGTVHVQDADSFIGYLAKHALSETEVWADPAKRALVGVINAHTEADHNAAQSDLVPGLAGHRDHRVVLDLVVTKPWATWTGLDKKWLDQPTFAEHIEDNLVDVIHPDAATMLEIAQSLQATTNSEFQRAERLHNGQVTFRHVETTTAAAGQQGEFEVPTEFSLGLAPFEGADLKEVVARFRYRIRNGSLALSYALVRPDDVIREAYLEHVNAVSDAIDRPIFQGRPE